MSANPRNRRGPRGHPSSSCGGRLF
jgi:hypothetical protein